MLNDRIPMMYRGMQLESPVNALQQVLQVQGQQQGNALQRLQMQSIQQQQAERQAAAMEQAQQRNALAQFKGSIASPQMAASQQALAGGGGPTMANAARMPAVDPRMQMMYGAMQAGQMSPLDYVKQLHPEQKLQAVGMDQNIVDMNAGGRVVTPGQAKPAPKPSAVQEFEYGLQNPAFNAWNLQGKKAGATNVSVSTGQKGYENESKLRNDFKSEPIYKDFSDMQVAYKQITAALNSKTPIGDTAAATKMMKLLDPGSVVRESELAIAMAAAGKLDRLQNYLQMKVSGESLTPTQRGDFAALASELYQAAGQAYNVKRDEYAKLGERYGLDPSSLGGAYTPPVRAPAKPASGGGAGNTVRTPDGQVLSFPTPEAAAAFKRDAGL